MKNKENNKNVSGDVMLFSKPERKQTFGSLQSVAGMQHSNFVLFLNHAKPLKFVNFNPWAKGEIGPKSSRGPARAGMLRSLRKVVQ